MDTVTRKLFGERTWVREYADSIKCVGTTGAAAIQNIWAANEEKSVTLAAGEYNNLQLFDPSVMWFLLNSIYGDASSIRKTTKIFIHQYTVSAKITNTETGPCDLIEYRCAARRDQPYHNDNQPLSGANLLARDGFLDASYNTASGMGAAQAYTQFGVGLFTNPAWCRQYRIRKVRTMTLAPGETREIKYSFKGYKCIGMETIQPISGSSNTPRDVLAHTGLSVFCLRGRFGQHGTGTAGYQQGVTNASIGIIYHIAIRYTVPALGYIEANHVNDLAGYGYGVAVAPAPAMLVGTGAINDIEPDN